MSGRDILRPCIISQIGEKIMAEIVVRDKLPADDYFVTTCSHMHESAEIDACSAKRSKLFDRLAEQGMVIKTGLLDGKQAGMLYMLPVEISPWGPLGSDLMAIPCLFVLRPFWGSGLGKALTESAIADARASGRKGLTMFGFTYPGAEWFMPIAFAQKMGFTITEQKGPAAVLWMPFAPDAQPPRLFTSQYNFQPIPGKVVVDLFFNDFCQTSCIEAQNVRDVCAEFGDRVLLHEHDAGDPATVQKYQLERGIYINGKEIFWGYEAPKEGIREAIEKAL
jgi:GNAT superfamily N-acetyltransferase